MIRHLIAAALAAFALDAFASVEVNQASQAELRSVKGVGSGLSGKIVEARKAGSFKDWTDLSGRVSGIGSSKAMHLSEAGLTVAGSGYVAPARVPPVDKAAKRAKAPKAAKASA